MAILKVENLVFQYPGEGGLSFPDFSVKKGQHVLVLGQSGSGKTTLLHLLGGLLRLQGGEISMNEHVFSSMSPKEQDRFRGQHLGFVFQTPHFVPSINVQENLELASHLARRPIDRNWINELLQRLHIADKASSRIRDLSVGELQRVAIARALVNKPDWILADEPTSALDDDNCDRVIHLLEESAGQTGSSLIIVTHDNRLKGRYANEVHLEKQLAV
jgi:ABC-type lipoprotein export system ATPase subunit